MTFFERQTVVRARSHLVGDKVSAMCPAFSADKLKVYFGAVGRFALGKHCYACEQIGSDSKLDSTPKSSVFRTTTFEKL